MWNFRFMLRKAEWGIEKSANLMRSFAKSSLFDFASPWAKENRSCTVFN